MPGKQMMFDNDARARLLSGVRKTSAAVKVTLGPRGRNAVLQRSFGNPVITKDGVTVAKEVELQDPFENIGAKLVKDASSKTNDVAGDGTTTAALLTEAIFAEGLKLVSTASVNAAELKRGIDKAVEAACESLAGQARQVKGSEHIRQVATLSANGDTHIGDLLTQALEKVGKEGVVTVEEGKSAQTVLNFTDGLSWDKGFISPYFVTDPKSMKAELDRPYVFVYEKKIGGVRELLPLLEKIAATRRALFIIAEDIEGDALAALMLNKLRGTLQVCAVKAPAFGDRCKLVLQDIAIYTGGKAVTEDLGIQLEAVSLDMLGSAERIIVDKDNFTVIGGKGAKAELNARIEQLRNEIKKTTSTYDKEKLEERLGKLAGGVAVIEVGGSTETEMKERKARVEDALHATRAALAEGIVPGGGVALMRAIERVEKTRVRGDEALGVQIVAQALASPVWQLAHNAGLDADVVVNDVRNAGGSRGYDINSQTLVDMFKEGIVDPLKVTRAALQNAASTAGMLLTMKAVITDMNTEKDRVAGAVV